MKKIILGFFAAFLLLLLCSASVLFFFNKPILHFVGVRYFQSKGIHAEFSIDQLSWTQLRLKDIRLQKNTFIPLLDIQFSLGKPGLEKLTSVQAHVETLDVNEAQEIASSFASDSEAEPVTFKSLSSDCAQLDSSQLELEVKNLKYNQTELPIELKFNHLQNSQKFTLLLSATANQNSKVEYFKAERFFFESGIEVSCAPDALKLAVTKLNSQAKNLKIPNPPFALKELNLSVLTGEVSITDNDRVQIALAPEVNLLGQLVGKEVALTSSGLSLNANFPLADFRKAQIQVSGNRFRLTSPYNISMGNFKLALMGETEALVNSGTFLIEGFKYIDETGAPLIQGANGRGTFSIGEELYTANLTLTDAASTLNFQSVELEYRPESGDYELKIQGPPSEIKVSPKISETIPMAGTYLQEGSGKLLLSGNFGSKNEILTGRLALVGKNISIKTEYGEFKNLEIKHELLSYPELKSAKHSRLSAKEVVVGPSIYDIEFLYEVVDKSLVNVEKLMLTYDGANFETGPFTVRPLEPSVEGLKARVRNLDLQKLLALGLKDAVTAEGALKGTVELTYKNKIPSVEGHLLVTKPGWIRYRPGEKPPKLMRLSDGPMEILNGYLYDFYYETLSVDIKTDDKYNMIMTLSTLGRNPEYLRGKPLKLNINIEQNLFAALETMMLTYDLPNRLKEHLEKASP